MRWQKWAIYQRLAAKDMYQYSLDDYIFQNLLRDLDNKAASESNSSSIWQVIGNAHRGEQELVRARQKLILESQLD